MNMRSRAALLTVCLAGVTVATTALADDSGTTTYQVVPGDTCDKIAAKLFGDARRIDIIHRYNPNLGPVPHVLKPGSTLVVPTSLAADPDARLGYVRHEVSVEAPAPRPGHPNDPLFRGNRVSTAESSSAGVRFRDDTQVVLGENTLIVILGDTSSAIDRQGTAHLESGALRARLAAIAGRKPAVVTTPGADVRMAGGESKVSVDPAKATRVAVYAGQSEIAAQRARVAVNQGFGSKAEMGKAPTPPRPLPPAPAWTTQPAVFVFVGKPTADVTGEYAAGTGPGPSPNSWHVQIAHDVAFEDLVVDTTVPLTVTHLEAKQVPAGTYVARVSAIDFDAFEGPFGGVAKVQVATWTSTPLPGRHTRIEIAPPGTVCGLDDAPLAPTTLPLDVDTTRKHALRCAPSAGVAPVEATIPATLVIQVADVTLANANYAARTADVVVRVRDEQGQPLVGVDPVLSAPDGVDVGKARPGAEPGTYLFPIRWRANIRVASLTLKAGESESVTLPLVALEPKAAAAPVHRIFEGAEVAIASGFAVDGAGIRNATPTAAATLAGRFDLGHLELLVGVRTGVERAPGTPAVPGGDDLYTVGLPLTFRAPLTGTSWNGTMSTVPMLGMVESSRPVLAGVSQSLGVEHALGPGSLGTEFGYRWMASTGGTHSLFEGNGGGFVGSVGYRFGW